MSSSRRAAALKAWETKRAGGSARKTRDEVINAHAAKWAPKINAARGMPHYKSTIRKAEFGLKSVLGAWSKKLV